MPICGFYLAADRGGTPLNLVSLGRANTAPVGATLATSKPKSPRHGTSADTSLAVDEFMAKLEPPLKDNIQALREAILAVDSSVGEGIKWNAPSFRTTEYFATTNLRSKAGIGLVLHLGAKIRELPTGGVHIDDPRRLLKWLGKDRAQVEFGTRKELEEKTPALQAVLSQWIKYV